MNDPATPPQVSQALLTAWKDQRRTSIAADKVKASYAFWRMTLLGLAILVAILGTASGQLPNESLGRILAGLGALLIALVPVIASFQAGSERLRHWIGTRSVSEELKAEVFRYLTRCGDYSEDDAEAKLAEVTTELMENLEASVLATIEPDGKPVPEVTGIDDFVRIRVDGQIGYYRGAAKREAGVVTRNRRAQFVLAMIAALIGGAGAFLNELTVAAWVAVVTTVAASITAHVAAGRHEHLVLTYTSTARRLEYLKARWVDNPQEDHCTFVAECEAAISSQNEGWMAQFMKKD